MSRSGDIIDLSGDDWASVQPETISALFVNYKKKQMLIKLTQPEKCVLWVQTEWMDLYEDSEIFNLPKKDEETLTK